MIKVKLDGKLLDELLTTTDEARQNEVVDMVKDISAQIGNPMPEAVEEALREEAVLPTTQMLLFAFVTKGALLLEVAEAMLKADVASGIRKKRLEKETATAIS